MNTVEQVIQQESDIPAEYKLLFGAPFQSRAEFEDRLKFLSSRVRDEFGGNTNLIFHIQIQPIFSQEDESERHYILVDVADNEKSRRIVSAELMPSMRAEKLWEGLGNLFRYMNAMGLVGEEVSARAYVKSGRLLHNHYRNWQRKSDQAGAKDIVESQISRAEPNPESMDGSGSIVIPEPKEPNGSSDDSRQYSDRVSLEREQEDLQDDRKPERKVEQTERPRRSRRPESVPVREEEQLEEGEHSHERSERVSGERERPERKRRAMRQGSAHIPIKILDKTFGWWVRKWQTSEGKKRWLHAGDTLATIAGLAFTASAVPQGGHIALEQTLSNLLTSATPAEVKLLTYSIMAIYTIMPLIATDLVIRFDVLPELFKMFFGEKETRDQR